MASTEAKEQARNLHWFGADLQEMANLLRVTPEKAEAILAEAYGQPASNDPTPGQIRDRAAQIREAWTPAERQLRRYLATSEERTGSQRRADRRDALRLA